MLCYEKAVAFDHRTTMWTRQPASQLHLKTDGRNEIAQNQECCDDTTGEKQSKGQEKSFNTRRVMHPSPCFTHYGGPIFLVRGHLASPWIICAG